MATTSIRLVLVSPLYAGNLGSVARLAANYDVDDVVLVSPKCDLRDPQARMFATGVAVENLSRFRVVGTLPEALEGCARRIAFSSRQTLLGLPEVELRNCGSWFSPPGTFAIVFGPEDVGLRREELALCSEICSLPVSLRKSSLNLSHAVAVVLSRLFEHGFSATGAETAEDFCSDSSSERASASEVDMLMVRWRETLFRMGFDERTGPDAMAGKIRNVILRADVSSHEVATFHAFLKGLEKRL